MERVSHVTNTWLLAIVIHGLLWAGCILFYSSDMALAIAAWLSLTFIGVTFSVPAYLLCVLCFSIIKRRNWGLALKLIVWMVLALVNSVISLIFVLSLLKSELQLASDTLLLAIPGCVSSSLSILLRRKQFFIASNPKK